MQLIRTTEHPNRKWFEGKLCYLDSPSDKAPSGARAHRILIPTGVGGEALDSLIGMGVNFAPFQHDTARKVGIITEAWIKDCAIYISGFIYAKDFPLVISTLQASEEFGLSYESHDTTIADMREDVWTATKLTFTGAAILLKEKAAYCDTWIKI